LTCENGSGTFVKYATFAESGTGRMKKAFRKSMPFFPRTAQEEAVSEKLPYLRSKKHEALSAKEPYFVTQDDINILFNGYQIFLDPDSNAMPTTPVPGEFGAKAQSPAR